MRWKHPIFLAAVLSGCTPAAPPETDRGAPRPAAEAADFRGDWQLARLDGQAAIDQPPNGDIPAAIRLVVGDRTVRANSQCVGFAWRYEMSADRITLTPANAGVMCARGLTTWESHFDRVMNAVTGADVVDGLLHLSGPAGELEFSRAPPPVAANLTGEWVLKRLDGAAADVAGNPAYEIVVTITPDTLRAQSQCVRYWWRYRQSGEQLELTPDDPGPVCERMRTEQEQQFERLVSEVTTGHLVDSRTLILNGAKGQAELRRRE